MADLDSNVLRFCALLREQYGFGIGHAQAHEALRALESIGIGERRRVRFALRMVCCSKREELERFDLAFDDFFSGTPGLPQRRMHRNQAGETHPQTPPGAQREPQDEESPADTARALRARYSPAAAAAPAPAVPEDGMTEALAAAGRLVANLRIGRSRRWKPHLRGPRFDLRRTLRASLQTGGDPARIRMLGHPRRNPRIVLLIDGSRSMSDYAPALLQFGYALVRRSRRASVFVFSTELREITRPLRSMRTCDEREIESLGEAWGGGTRIGACLRAFVRRYSARLDADTLLAIASDGLDAGETAMLRDAMRQIHRRCAGVVWLNPHANVPGFEPAACGMQAALPYISGLLNAGDLQRLAAAARNVRG